MLWCHLALNDRRLLCRIVVTSRAEPEAGPAPVRSDRPPVRWSAEERGILDDSQRFKRLQNVYSARNNRELASSYDEWAEDYEDDMLSLGYATPAVAAGFVGRHVPLGGTMLDAGAGTGMFGSILHVLGYEDLVGIDISERMLEKASEKDAYHSLHRMVLGEPLGFDDGSFSAAVSVGVFTTNHAPPEALDELVRVVEPDGWVIFSVRDDVYRKEGFEEKQASLEKEGKWRRVTMSEAFQPFPAAHTSHMVRLFVYKTG
jgi:SAM-dependent methyltransferase